MRSSLGSTHPGPVRSMSKALSSTSPGSGPRPATARAGVRRPGTRSGCGRGGSRAGPGRGRRSSRTADAGGGVDLGLVGAADEPLPAEAGAVEPVDELDPAERAAAVDDLGEGGGAAAARRSGGGRRRPRSSRGGSGGSRPGPAAGRRGRAAPAAPAPAPAPAAPAASRRRGPAGGGGRRPGRRGAQARRLPIVAGQAAAGVDLAAGRDSGDRGEQQQGDQRRQAGLLDARRASLPILSPSASPRR